MTKDNLLFRISTSQGGEKNYSSHTHKTASWYLLGVLFKMFDKHPHVFYMVFPLGYT